MGKILKVIDSISEYSGKGVSWVCLALILVLAYETVMRHVFDAPTIWAHLLAMMLGGTAVFMGCAYTHLHHGHLRIDVLYGKFPPRVKAIIDAVLDVIFFFPLLGVLIYSSASWAWRSWMTGELRIESWWYPPAAPFRTVMLIGLSLFALQCVAQFLRELYLLVRNRPYV